MLASALTAVSKVQQVFSPSLHNSYQPGITSPTLPYSTFTTIHLQSSFDTSQLRAILSSIQELNSEVLSLDSSSGLQTVLGIESRVWSQLHNEDPSKLHYELKPFKAKKSTPFPSTTSVPEDASHQEVTREGEEEEEVELEFPETGGDLFLFSKSTRQDLCYEVSKRFLNRLKKMSPNNPIKKVESTNGFSYLGGKDLTGFHDGTRNPPILSAIVDAAILGSGGEDDPDKSFLGGSYLLSSRFVHDLDKFDLLSKNSQSALIGRDYHSSSTQLGKPMNPHLPDLFEPLEKPKEIGLPSRQYHINRGYGPFYRQAYPYGTVEENGLYFICFCRSLRAIDEALERMLGNKGGGRDNIFQITKAVTTNYYYCPSIRELQLLK